MKPLRYLFTILFILSCAALAAQELPNVLVVHETDGTATQVAVASIDSITFEDADVMLIFQPAAAVLSFPIARIEWMDFATVPETELYEAVDLGLTVRWAVFNIGATTPEGYGDFFAWGETTAKDSYSEATYTHYDAGAYRHIGANICGTQYDAARQAWGGLWRLPTRSEVADLMSKCTWQAETLNGVSGYRVTGTNGQSIFLPAAGYMEGSEQKEQGTGGFYWTGNVNRSMTSAAYNLNFRGYDDEWSASRALGFTLRAVK